MAIQDNGTRDQYVASAAQTIFQYTFEIFDKGDIAVEQNGTLLAEGTNYTVSGVGVDSGGNVTLTVGATAGDILTLYRDMELVRVTDFQQNGDFLSAEVNDDFDRLWSALQQIESTADVGIRPAVNDVILNSSNTELADVVTRAGKILGFAANGTIDYFSASIAGGGLTDVSTTAAMTGLTGLSVGVSVVYTKEFSAGVGAPGYWDVSLTSSVTPNGTTIIIGVADPLISFVLRKTQVGQNYLRNDNDGFARPIIEADLGAASTVKLWANNFSQNFILTNGGALLNDTASGTKDGNNNTAFGFNNFTVATTIFASAAFGYNALNAVTTGDSNTALGYQTLLKCTTGKNNTTAGTDAGFNITTGSSNTLIGRHVFFDAVAEATGDNNSCLGFDIALEASTMNNMVIVGAQAQRDGTVSARSVVIGTSAAQDMNTINDSVAIGRQVLQNIPAATTVANTVEIGARVNENALSATENAIVGWNSMFTLTQGLTNSHENCMLGSQTALNVYGSNNVMIGRRAGARTSIGSLTGTVLIGYRAGDQAGNAAADNDFIISNNQLLSNALINGNFSARNMTIEATALNFKNIPTVGTGASGTIWSDSGTIKIVP